MKNRKNIIKMAYGGDPVPKKVVKPIKLPKLTTDQLEDFGNFAGSHSVLDMNKTLDKYGLKGAGNLYENYSDDISQGGNAITGARQDWIGSTTARAIANARKLSIPPEAFEANIGVILGKDRYSDTILNNKDFARMYPNYVQTLSRIYKDRLDNYKPDNTENMATTSPENFGNGGVIGGLAKAAPDLMGMLMTLIDGAPEQSTQPIVNSSTMKNMSNPYSNMAYGGIHIKKSHEGRFTAYKKRTGKTTEEALHSKDPHVRKMAQFAKNAKKWKHAYGGDTNDDVELEGGEVIETPNGEVDEVKGPKHENGGVDMNLPNGTEVFSNRLKVEGKSMKARKLAREKRMEKVEKLLKRQYPTQIAKNTAERTMRNIENENRQDMTLQRVASQIYAPPKERNTTDREAKKYAFGDIVGDEDFPTYANRVNGIVAPYDIQIPYGANNLVRTPLPIEGMQPEMVSSLGTINPNVNLAKNISTPSNIVPQEDGYNFTTGDYVGMAGTALGSILPLVNTLNNRKATAPNINRFRGYGHDALETNDTAQNYLDTSRGNELADIDTSLNSAYSRNNNSASGVNTARALNIAADIGANKARTSTRANFAKQMIGTLGQRSELENAKDYREMSGDMQVDAENKMDTDNFYSNLGANFSNLATGVQEIGRNFNIRQGNNDDSELLGLLTKNGIRIGRDKSGKLRLMNN